MYELETLRKEASELLKSMVQTTSFSGRENGTAKLIEQYLKRKKVNHIRINNNILCGLNQIDTAKTTCLLNSHHDTVKVVNGWTKDPFGAEISDGKMYGLGSNDAGASLVSLIAAYIYLHDQDLEYNIVLAASAEEENFGPLGIKSLISKELAGVDFGIVGEPTNMEMAVAEKGLLVIDGEAKGRAGHAARKEGENAIYKAIEDITRIAKHEFVKVSATLGANVMSVTQVNAGIQHNVVPDSCKFVIDLRVNDCYSLQEAFAEVQEITKSSLKARSFNNNSSGIALDHPLAKAGKNLGLHMFGSATLSDQANMPFPTIKMGPGFSERSHTPDEFVYLTEIEKGVIGYVAILKELNKCLSEK